MRSICITMVAIEREHFGDYGEIIRTKGEDATVHHPNHPNIIFAAFVNKGSNWCLQVVTHLSKVCTVTKYFQCTFRTQEL
jgi:hypothetical protein